MLVSKKPYVPPNDPTFLFPHVSPTFRLNCNSQRTTLIDGRKTGSNQQEFPHENEYTDESS